MHFFIRNFELMVPTFSEAFNVELSASCTVRSNYRSHNFSCSYICFKFKPTDMLTASALFGSFHCYFIDFYNVDLRLSAPN